jgi:hypothetical protein
MVVLFSISLFSKSEQLFVLCVLLAVNNSFHQNHAILRWKFRKWEEVVGTGWSWLQIRTGGGHL